MHDQTHGKAQSKQVVKDLAQPIRVHKRTTLQCYPQSNNFFPLTYLSGQQFICYLSPDAGIKQ